MTHNEPGRLAWRVGAAAWLAVIGWCTLRSDPGAAADIAKLSWYCVVCGDAGVADVLLNILLFFPLGVALHALGWPLRRTLLVVATISTSIEVIQGNYLIGRDSCIGDVLSNTTGGIVGWLSYTGLISLGRPTSSSARRGALLLLILMAAIWLATGAGLRPSLTEQFAWIGQPSHVGRGPVPFPGTVQRETFDGIDVPNDELGRFAPWRDSVVIEVDATRNSGELFSRGIVLLRIVDTAHTVQVAMDQKGDDAWLRLRLRAADWKLHYPRWLVSHAMRMSPGEPWRFRWSWLRDRIVIINEPIAGPPNPVVTVPLSIGLGWTFVHPFVNQVSESRWLWTTLWLGFWFGWLGWLAGWLGARMSIAIGTTAIGIFAGASVVAGFSLQLGEVVAAVGAYAIATTLATRAKALAA